MRDATDWGDKLVQKIYANPFVLSPFYKPTPEDAERVPAAALLTVEQQALRGPGAGGGVVECPLPGQVGGAEAPEARGRPSSPPPRPARTGALDQSSPARTARVSLSIVHRDTNDRLPCARTIPTFCASSWLTSRVNVPLSNAPRPSGLPTSR